MTTTVYGIRNCDSVQRARRWLTEHAVEHQFHDFAKAGVPPERLLVWVQVLGWQVLVNRNGTTWRKLDESTQASVVDAESAMRVMGQHASLIKRPVVEWADGQISVGFDADAWLARAALLHG